MGFPSELVERQRLVCFYGRIMISSAINANFPSSSRSRKLFNFNLSLARLSTVSIAVLQIFFLLYRIIIGILNFFSLLRHKDFSFSRPTFPATDCFQWHKFIDFFFHKSSIFIRHSVESCLLFFMRREGDAKSSRIKILN